MFPKDGIKGGSYNWRYGEVGGIRLGMEKGDVVVVFINFKICAGRNSEEKTNRL